MARERKAGISYLEQQKARYNIRINVVKSLYASKLKTNPETPDHDLELKLSFISILNLTNIASSRKLKAFYSLNLAFPDVIKSLFGLDAKFFSNLNKLTPEEKNSIRDFLYFATDAYISLDKKESLFHIAAKFGAASVLESLMRTCSDEKGSINSNNQNFLYNLKLYGHNELHQTMLENHPELNELDTDHPLLLKSPPEMSPPSALDSMNKGVAYYYISIFGLTPEYNCNTRNSYSNKALKHLIDYCNAPINTHNPLAITCLLDIYHASKNENLLTVLQSTCSNASDLSQYFIASCIKYAIQTKDTDYLDKAYKFCKSSNSLEAHVIIAVYAVKHGDWTFYKAIRDDVSVEQPFRALQDVDNNIARVFAAFNQNQEIIDAESDLEFKAKLKAASVTVQGLCARLVNVDDATALCSQEIVLPSAIKKSPQLLIEACKLKALALQSTDIDGAIEIFNTVIHVMTRMPGISLRAKVEIFILKGQALQEKSVRILKLWGQVPQSKDIDIDSEVRNTIDNAIMVYDKALNHIWEASGDAQALYNSVLEYGVENAYPNELKIKLSELNIFGKFREILYHKFYCYIIQRDSDNALICASLLDYSPDEEPKLYTLLARKAAGGDPSVFAEFLAIDPDTLSPKTKAVYKKIAPILIRCNEKDIADTETSIGAMEAELTSVQEELKQTHPEQPTSTQLVQFTHPGKEGRFIKSEVKVRFMNLEDLPYEFFTTHIKALAGCKAGEVWLWLSRLKSHHRIFQSECQKIQDGRSNVLQKKGYVDKLLAEYDSILENHENRELSCALITPKNHNILKEFHKEVQHFTLNLLQIVFGIQAIFLGRNEYARKLLESFEANPSQKMLKICIEIGEEEDELLTPLEDLLSTSQGLASIPETEILKTRTHTTKCPYTSENFLGIYTDWLDALPSQLAVQTSALPNEEAERTLLQSAAPSSKSPSTVEVFEYFNFVLDVLLMPDSDHDVDLYGKPISTHNTGEFVFAEVDTLSFF
ncbi:MAG: hypothetical protein COA94_06935 [Rickettsiales bacterium]|nr:MAG: hypothetical protein COA94_06935 [Rickettsiales bacterium]